MPKIADAYIEIRTDSRKLTAGLKTSERNIKTFAARSARWLAPLRKSFAQLGGILRSNLRRASVAFAGLVAGMVLAVRAAAKQEAAEAELAASLERLGASVEKQTRRFKEFASAIQVATGIADEEFLPTMALGANLAGIHGKQLEKLSLAAIGLSKVIGVDVKTSMMLLARAVKGQFQLFSRYGIALDQNATAQENFDSIMRTAISGFQLATAEMKTTAGAMLDLRNATGDLVEEIGNLISQRGGVKGVLSDMADLARGTQALLKVRREQHVSLTGRGMLQFFFGEAFRMTSLGRALSLLTDIAKQNRQTGAELARWDKVRLGLTRERLEKEQISVDLAAAAARNQERALKAEQKRVRAQEKIVAAIRKQREALREVVGQIAGAGDRGEFERRELGARLLELQGKPFAARRVRAEEDAERRRIKINQNFEAQTERLGKLRKGGLPIERAARIETQMIINARADQALSRKVLRAQLAAIERDRAEAKKAAAKQAEEPARALLSDPIRTRQRGAAFTGGMAGLHGAFTAVALSPMRESVSVQKDMLLKLEQIRKGVFAFTAVGN